MCNSGALSTSRGSTTTRATSCTVRSPFSVRLPCFVLCILFLLFSLKNPDLIVRQDWTGISVRVRYITLLFHSTILYSVLYCAVSLTHPQKALAPSTPPKTILSWRPIISLCAICLISISYLVGALLLVAGQSWYPYSL